MRILLVSPASGYWHGLGRKHIFNGKSFRFSMLSLLTVASLTPRKHEVTLVDEQFDEVPLDGDFDVVGITVMTATAPRAYELAAQFRARGIPVVMGGFHPTFNLDEARQHADAVVVGPAYGAWEQALADIEAGALKPVYHGTFDVPARMETPKHLLSKSKYLSIHTTFATLGCRNGCQFCSIKNFYNRKRYLRPVDAIIEELQSFPEKFVMFIDDNLTQDREFALELIQKLAPLNKRWMTQASIEVADDPEMLAAMQASGCIGLFIGLETRSRETLEHQKKTMRPPEYYREAIQRLHKHGIYVEAGIMFGFENDGPEVFQETLPWLDDLGVDAIQVSIVTPLPGTNLYEAMKGRIFDHNWEHYDFKHAVFTPARMTAEQLHNGARWVRRQFYAPWRIARRLLRWVTQPAGWRTFPYPLVTNMAYYGRNIRFHVKGYNPAQPEPFLARVAEAE